MWSALIAYTMKYKTLIFGFLVIFTVLFFSCQKFEPINDYNTEQELTLNDLNYSSEFNWTNYRIIQLNISSENAQVLNITSTDQLIRYHKGMHPGKAVIYTIKISIALHKKKFSINHQEFDIKSNVLNITL